jgi:hypothetical protein
MIPTLPDLTPIQEQVRVIEQRVKDTPAPVVQTIDPSGEEIVDKINALPTNDDKLKIDAKHIKNLPKGGPTAIWGTNGIRGITEGDNIRVTETISEYPTVDFTGYTGLTHITVGPTAPANPNLYDLWVDTN